MSPTAQSGVPALFWVAASTLITVAPAPVRADTVRYVCEERGSVRAASGSRAPDLVVAADGQLAFRGFATQDDEIAGRRLPGGRYLRATAIVEIDPALIGADGSVLRVDVRAPDEDAAPIACGLIEAPDRGPPRFSFDLPAGVSPRAELQVRVYASMEDPDDLDVSARARARHRAAVRRREQAIYATVGDLVDGSWRQIERDSFLRDLSADVAAAIDALPLGGAPSTAQLEALRTSLATLGARVAATRSWFGCGGGTGPGSASPLGPIACDATEALTPLSEFQWPGPATPGGPPAAPSPAALAALTAAHGRLRGSAAAPGDPPEGYCRALARLTWLATDTMPRLLARGRVPFVSDQDRIETREHGRGSISTTIDRERVVGVVVQRAPPGAVDIEVSLAADGGSPDAFARVAALFLRYVIGAQSGVAPASRPARGRCDQGQSTVGTAVRVDDELGPVHRLETYAVPLGRVPEGRRATGRVCAGESCVAEGAGQNVRNTFEFAVEPNPHPVFMVAVGLAIPSLPPALEFEPVDGAPGPDRAFRVVEGSYAPRPSVALLAGLRFCRFLFAGIGTSVYLDGFDSLRHWFGAVGFRIPQLSRALYLLLSGGVVVSSRLTGYDAGQVVSVPRAAMGETPAPTAPSEDTVTAAVAVHLGFDFELVGDVAKEIVEAVD